MNIWAFSVACITLAAFLAHVFIGTRETAALARPQDDARRMTHWVQAMCAFQMLSVDLLLVALALFAIAVFDFGAVERPAVQLLGALFLLWGLVWLVQMKWLSRPGVTLWQLPQWAVWFFCSALLFLGS